MRTISDAGAVRIAAIDPGFADLAVAVLDVEPDGALWFVEAARLSTKKESRKRMTHVGTDDGRRIDALSDELLAILARSAPLVIGYELPAASKGARAGHALGIAHAVVRLTARRFRADASLVECTVLDARLAAVGRSRGRATEDEAHAMIRDGSAGVSFPGPDAAEWLARLSTHELDAIAVGIATARSSVVLALRASRAGR